MQGDAFRHEVKHLINRADALALRSRLRCVLRPDEHAGPDGSYRVRSLYFDNEDDKALKEKLDGVDPREKFRIRYYNGDESFIRLEKKSKIRSLCGKKEALLTRSDCERLLRGDWSWMERSGDPLLLELSVKMRTDRLRPKTLVDYRREAFVYAPGNVRVTIDSDIRTGLHANDLFRPCTDLCGAGLGSAAVLEVKYDSFLPELLRDLVQTPDRRCSSYSKYAACRVYG